MHLAAGLASGLVILAFLAIRDYLRDAGDHRLSAVGVPFVAIGSTLLAMLPGMEVAALAAAQTTGTGLADIAAAQAALQDWFVPVMVVGASSFATGVLAFMRSITITGILSTPLTAFVVAALAVMALSRLVPLAAAQLYLHSAAGILALWPPGRARESPQTPTVGSPGV